MELVVTHRGSTQRIELDEQAGVVTVATLQRVLEGTFSVSSNSAIKLLLPGRKGALQLSEQPQRTLKEAGLEPGMRAMMLATSLADVQQVQAAKEDRTLPGFDHELRLAALRRGRGRAGTSTSSPSGSEWTFLEYRSWQAPGLYPTPSEALSLLHRLAADRGILRVMADRRWKVGVLSELPPEGKVGISPVCVLGLNVNQGQEIMLRLRTDDLRGFRKYESIRDTLVHELVHNVHGDHDAAFKALNSQLKKEVLAEHSSSGAAYSLLQGALFDADGTDGRLDTGHWAMMDDEEQRRGVEGLMEATARLSGQTLKQIAAREPAAATHPSSSPQVSAGAAAAAAAEARWRQARSSAAKLLPPALASNPKAMGAEAEEGEGHERWRNYEHTDPATELAEAAARQLEE